MNIFKKLYDKIKSSNLTDEDISNIIINKIRKGGGTVGDNVSIYVSSIDLGEPYLINIGNNVTITGVKILTHDASLKKTIGYTKTGKVHIGNDVFIGWGSIILPNVNIGNKVVIGAGCIIAKDIPDNSVVIGNPAKILCSYDDYVNKTYDLMKEYPVIDMFPKEILKSEENINKLKDKGFGYIK